MNKKTIIRLLSTLLIVNGIGLFALAESEETSWGEDSYEQTYDESAPEMDESNEDDSHSDMSEDDELRALKSESQSSDEE